MNSNKKVIKSLFLLLLLMISFVLVGCTKSEEEISVSEKDEIRMQAVKTHLDNVLRNSRSKIKNTSLLADGIDTFTGELASWANKDQTFSPISDYASQQNFMRTLVAYSAITGDMKYKNSAIATTKYFMKYFQHNNGLLKWGGHEFINIDTLLIEGPENKGLVHELKNHYPYYELMLEVDEDAVKKYLEQQWAAHVIDWSTLDINRHGENTTVLTKYEVPEKSNSILLRPVPTSDVVDPSNVVTTATNTQALQLPNSQGLTFINAGSDLYYAAYLLGELTGNPMAISWGKYLARQYQLARNPETGLPVYQFTQPLQRDTTTDDTDTNSKFGDRAKRQFGDDFGAVALEGNVLFKNISAIIIDSMNINLYIGEKFDDQELLSWTVDTLKKYYQYALCYDQNQIMRLLPMWNDGQSMLGYVFKKDGYYGDKGTVVDYLNMSSENMLTIARACELFPEDQELWDLLREVAKGLGYGDIGADKSGKELALQMNPTSPITGTSINSSFGVMSFVYLYEMTKKTEYLDMARTIADNIVATKFHRGYFVKSEAHRYCRINDNDALALLTLAAAISGKLSEIPVYLSDTGYVHGDYYDYSKGKVQNGYDTDYIYEQTN